MPSNLQPDHRHGVQTNHIPPIYILPIEILHQIISCLDVKDIIALASTSKTLKASLLDNPDGIWRILCRRDLYVADPVPPHPYVSFWDLYVHAVTPFHWIKSSLWIGDSVPFGDVYITKYDRQSGSLALFKLLCRDSDPNNDGTGTGFDTQTQQNDNEQAQNVNNHRVVSTSTFLHVNVNGPNANNNANPGGRTTQTVVSRFQEPISGNRGGGRQVRQLPSNPDITYYPEQGYALTFGPYICLNKFSERDGRTGMWKFPFRTNDGTDSSNDSNRPTGTNDQTSNNNNNNAIYKGPHMGLLRAVAIPESALDTRMSVWPPFTIPAHDRTRNASVNNFMGHYDPPFNAMNVGGGHGMASAIARAEAAHNAALAALRHRPVHANHQQNNTTDNAQQAENGPLVNLAEIEGIQGLNVNLPNAGANNNQVPDDQPVPRVNRTRTVVTRLPNGSIELRTENNEGNVIHVETTLGNANQQNIGIVGNAGAPTHEADNNEQPAQQDPQPDPHLQAHEEVVNQLLQNLTIQNVPQVNQDIQVQQDPQAQQNPQDAQAPQIQQIHQVTQIHRFPQDHQINQVPQPLPVGLPHGIDIQRIQQIHQAHLARLPMGPGGRAHGGFPGLQHIPGVNAGHHQINAFHQAHAQHILNAQNIHNAHLAQALNMHMNRPGGAGMPNGAVNIVVNTPNGEMTNVNHQQPEGVQVHVNGVNVNNEQPEGVQVHVNGVNISNVPNGVNIVNTVNAAPNEESQTNQGTPNEANQPAPAPAPASTDDQNTQATSAQNEPEVINSATAPPPEPVASLPDTPGDVTPVPTPPNFVPPSPDVFRIQRFMGLVHGKVETLFRLSEDLYTPTAACPYRGIWVSSQSFELMLFHQPNPNRLEAIKLTGGTHVRRGELCFVIDNLDDLDSEIVPNMYPEFFYSRRTSRTSSNSSTSSSSPSSFSFSSSSSSAPSQIGTRAVKAQGQVSEFNFSNPRFQAMSVFLMSHNKVVLYWKTKKIVDVCKRIQVDKLLKTDMNVQKLKA